MRERAGLDRCNTRTGAIALAALALYPLSVTLPMLRIEEFGHHNDASILTGIAQLFAGGHLLIGMIVLTCSLILPIAKLIGLLMLSFGGDGLRREHKALTYRVVEWTGRWGMLDVLLVAILVAVLKLGDFVEVTPGPAAAAFAASVLLSLLATASFDPHAIWETTPIGENA
ncbi:MAG: paraquat-inducible protein A [Phycisphaerales bacterium]|nr:paraquat-inducible protein A [Phycisphaerales bacterium]